MLASLCVSGYSPGIDGGALYAGIALTHSDFSIDDSSVPAGDITHISGNFYQRNKHFSA
jgi:hypothetical protein